MHGHQIQYIYIYLIQGFLKTQEWLHYHRLRGHWILNIIKYPAYVRISQCVSKKNVCFYLFFWQLICLNEDPKSIYYICLFLFTYNLRFLPLSSPTLFFLCNLCFGQTRIFVLKFSTFWGLLIAFLWCHLACPLLLVRNRGLAEAWLGKGTSPLYKWHCAPHV